MRIRKGELETGREKGREEERRSVCAEEKGRVGEWEIGRSWE